MTEPVDRFEVFGETDAAAERIAPGFAPDADVNEHVARYRWAAPHVAGAKVLDVASGVGYGAEILRAAGATHVGSVDRWLPALRFGYQRYELHPICGDVTCLPLADGSFDIVVSLETIEHIHDVDAFLAEVARVLVPGGRFLVSSPNLDRSKGNNPYHVNEMTLETLSRRLEQARFEIDTIDGQHWDVLWGALWRVRGVARLARRIDRSPRVGRSRLPGGCPRDYCVVARRTGQ